MSCPFQFRLPPSIRWKAVSRDHLGRLPVWGTLSPDYGLGLIGGGLYSFSDCFLSFLPKILGGEVFVFKRLLGLRFDRLANRLDPFLQSFGDRNALRFAAGFFDRVRRSRCAGFQKL